VDRRAAQTGSADSFLGRLAKALEVGASGLIRIPSLRRKLIRRALLLDFSVARVVASLLEPASLQEIVERQF